MANDLKGILIAVVLLGLFSVSLIYYAAQASVDNHSNVSILQNPSINKAYISLNNTLSQAEANANTQQTEFTKGYTGPSFGWLVITTLPSVIGSFVSLISSTWYAVANVIQDNLGVPPIVFGTITALLIIIMILYMWRTYRAGG